MVGVKTLELRRHAIRDPAADALSPEGRSQAETVGRGLPLDYSVLFVSPAQRTAETMAYFLRGSGQGLPTHAVIAGLGSEQEDRWRVAGKAAGSSRLDAIRAQDADLVREESNRLADVVKELVQRIPEGGRGLAVGHSPLIEAAVYGLLGVLIEPLSECEGVALTSADQGYRIQELRL
jgi:broad specificity phosphatase PhoE